jgi:hypothetical protein
MNEVWLNWKFKMATRRLFEHENNVHLYLRWILSKFGMQVSIGYVIIENENRVKNSNKFPPKIKINSEFVFLNLDFGGGIFGFLNFWIFMLKQPPSGHFEFPI